MKTIRLLFVALLAGCASVQQVQLLPRGEGNARGAGELNRLNNDLQVTLGAETYRGKMVMETSMSGGTFLTGPARTTYSNRASALLLGERGQVRCEFGFDQLMTQATGVCVDHRNITYDMLLK